MNWIYLSKVLPTFKKNSKLFSWQIYKTGLFHHKTRYYMYDVVLETC